MSVCEEGEGESEIQSISWIVSFLKPAFHDADYEKAERMLKWREEKLISAKNALEIELKKKTEELIEVRKNVVEAGEELEISQTKCSQLTIELEKKNKEYYDIFMEKGDLEFQNTSLSEEVKIYKRRCDTMKEQIMRLEKDREVISERENKAEEKIAALSGELKRIEKREKERYADLERENKELALAKSRRERETEAWKKRYKELEARVSQLRKEYLAIKQKDKQLVGNPEVEPESFVNKSILFEGADRHDSKMSETKYGANNGNKVCLVPSGSKVKSCSNEEIPTSAKAVHAPVKRKDCSDCPSTKSYNPLLCDKEEERDISSEFDLEYRCRTGKELVLELESSNKKPCASKITIEKPSIRDTIDISDSDNEAEITPTHTSKYGENCNMAFRPLENAEKEAIGNEDETTPQKRVTANPSIYFPLAKRSRKIDTSKTAKNRYLSCDEEIPVGKHKTKKLQDLADGIKNPMDSQVHKSSIAPTTPLEDKNAKKTIKLGQPLSPLKHCKEKGIRAEKTSNILVNNGTLPESGIPTSWDADKFVSLNKTVNTGQDDDSDSGNGSDNPADAWENGSAINQMVSYIKMSEQKKLRWQYESDMLSSLEEEPELCLLAICALYRQQGFSSFDVQRGRMLAEFLMGGTGNKPSGLKKSVKDFQMHDPNGLEQCKDLAVRYSSQLFKIYKSREDPFFL